MEASGLMTDQARSASVAVEISAAATSGSDR
jgi:hypothetical protein